MLVRLFKRLIRWGLVTFVLKKILKTKASKQAQQAAAEFQETLPPSIASSVDSLPPKVKAAAGSAIIAGRSAKKVIDAATGGRESVFKSFSQYQKSVKKNTAEAPSSDPSVVDLDQVRQAQQQQQQ